MKPTKLWLMAAILACGSLSTHAQDTKHEVGISIGAGSNSQILSSLDDLVETTATLGNISYHHAKSTGPIGVEYFYHLSPKVGLGGIATYVGRKKDAEASTGQSGEAKATFISVMPAVKLGWFEKEYIGMYTKLAAGLTYRHEKQDWADIDESEVKFNYQMSLIGLETGTKNFRAFFELGWGEQGIALIGLRYKF